MLPELECFLLSFLSTYEQVKWAETTRSSHAALELYYKVFLDTTNPGLAKAHEDGKSYLYLFVHRPKYRKDKYVPYDSRGTEYLRVRGIGGPITCQKIRDGDLTITVALKNRNAVLKELEEKLRNLEPSQEINSLLDGINKLLMHDKPPKRTYGCACGYLLDELITPDQMLALSSKKFDALTKGVLKYIDNGKLSIENAIALNFYQGFNLRQPGVQKYIDNGTLSIEKVIASNLSQGRNLNGAGIQKCIDNGELSMANVLALDSHQGSNLNGVGVQKYIDNGKLSIANALVLSPRQRRDLEIAGVQKYIDSGQLTVEQVFKLSEKELDDLKRLAYHPD